MPALEAVDLLNAWTDAFRSIRKMLFISLGTVCGHITNNVWHCPVFAFWLKLQHFFRHDTRNVRSKIIRCATRDRLRHTSWKLSSKIAIAAVKKSHKPLTKLSNNGEKTFAKLAIFGLTQSIPEELLLFDRKHVNVTSYRKQNYLILKTPCPTTFCSWLLLWKPLSYYQSNHMQLPRNLTWKISQWPYWRLQLRFDGMRQQHKPTTAKAVLVTLKVMIISCYLMKKI